MTADVKKLEDIINFHKQPEEKLVEFKLQSKKDNKYKEGADSLLSIPKGVRVSGKKWKNPKKRFSSIIKTRGYKAANKFEKLQALKQEVKRMRDLSRSIVDEKKKQIEAKKERRRLNIQRKKDNELKAEIVQIIKNPAKIKRMKKKHLRKIEKRDLLNIKR